MEKKPFYYVKKRTLLLIAGIVWFIAGFNVARLGIISYGLIDIKWYYYVLSVVVFGLFGTMFFMMSRKHTKRIKSYDEYKPFWNFFDIKAYIIMVIMMSGGIGLRVAGVFPDVFVAFFYTGLGLALTLAGVLFIYNFITYKKTAD
ncbi:MAG: hypothetical protein MJ166_00210 [Clostridia bacterium]|nr:hypothetical protein [Clostridia bacterium]